MHRGCTDAPAPNQLHHNCPGVALLPALLGSESQPQGSFFLLPVHAKPTLSVRTQGWDCKNVQYLGLQRKSLWFCTEGPVLMLDSPCLSMGSCVHPCRAWAQPGGAGRTLEVSQERRFPPVGFSHCFENLTLIPTFSMVSSPSEHDTHSVVKAVIENKSKFQLIE